MCNLKGVACSDQLTENYHLTLQLPLSLQSVSASFSTLFWFSNLQLFCICSFTLYLYSVSQSVSQSFPAEKKSSERCSQDCPLAHKRQQLAVNIVEPTQKLHISTPQFQDVIRTEIPAFDGHLLKCRWGEVSQHVTSP